MNVPILVRERLLIMLNWQQSLGLARVETYCRLESVHSGLPALARAVKFVVEQVLIFYAFCRSSCGLRRHLVVEHFGAVQLLQRRMLFLGTHRSHELALGPMLHLRRSEGAGDVHSPIRQELVL